MPEPVFSTDFDVRSLHAGQGVLFRVPEYLELELGTVTGPAERVVVYPKRLNDVKPCAMAWHVPVRAEAGVRLVAFREIAAAEVEA